MNQRFHKLSAQEDLVINQKKTEYPGSGEFVEHDESGIYLCKKCDQPLYLSSDKFKSGCGWPSFDGEIEGSVEKRLDADQERVEIVCNRCKGHLGHFFEGERLTEKNHRYCVNSLSLAFVEAYTIDGYAKAYFAAGCFWAVESYFKQVKGVIKTKVGYMGGSVVNPSYEEVCHLKTGHQECVEIIFDESLMNYGLLCRVFFELHDPFQVGGQGVDRGAQYESRIFYLTKDQKMLATALKAELENSVKRSMTTKIVAASKFYPAEEYHQNYLEKCRFDR